MLRVALILPDQRLAGELERAVLGTRAAVVAANLDHYPDAAELERLLVERGVEAVLLSYESPHRFATVASWLEKKAAGMPMAAVVSSADPSTLLELMRAGVRELITPPFREDRLREALDRLQKLVDSRTQSIERLYSFLPAKAGVGTSTVALNTAVALSRTLDGSVLLIDFDLHNGILAFLLKLSPRYSVVDAIEHAYHLDQDIWAKLVWPVGPLEVMPSGRLDPSVQVEAEPLRLLLAFARRYYKVICVDHSGMMEKHSLEILRESERIFLVTTAEVPALHLGAEKLNFLRGLDLGDRVEILLNRAHSRGLLSKQQIENMLGASIRASIPNDYVAVHNSIMEGKPMAEDSRLDKHFAEFARSLLSQPGAGSAKKRKLLEYFSLAPVQSPGK